MFKVKKKQEWSQDNIRNERLFSQMAKRVQVGKHSKTKMRHRDLPHWEPWLSLEDLFSTEEILIYSFYYSKHLLCFFMLIPRCHTVVPAFHNWSVWILKINNVGSDVLTGCVRTWNSLRLHKIHQKMREEKMNSQKFNKNIFVFTDDHILVQKCIPNIQASGVLPQKPVVFLENLCTG